MGATEPWRRSRTWHGTDRGRGRVRMGGWVGCRMRVSGGLGGMWKRLILCQMGGAACQRHRSRRFLRRVRDHPSISQSEIVRQENQERRRRRNHDQHPDPDKSRDEWAWRIGAEAKTACCHLPNDAITSCLREPEAEAEFEPGAVAVAIAALPTLFDLEGSPAEAGIWTSILCERCGGATKMGTK